MDRQLLDDARKLPPARATPCSSKALKSLLMRHHFAEIDASYVAYPNTGSMSRRVGDLAPLRSVAAAAGGTRSSS